MGDVIGHALEPEQLYKVLETGSKGLTKNEAEKRLGLYGYNEIKEKKAVSPIRIFFSQFNSFVVYILVAATIVSILIKEYIDAWVIAAILVVNAVLGFIQEYRAERSVEALKRLTAQKSRVMRDGKIVDIPARELVPGDVIELVAGDIVPADSRIIECYECATQEASLTGESTPVKKTVGVLKENTQVADRKNMVFSGTHVVRGKIWAIVVNTGMKTEIGKIAEMLQHIKPEPTPLQKKLGVLGRRLGVAVIVISVIVFFTGMLAGGDKGEVFMAAVALAVAAIPEGLPAVVTVTLALSVQRMVRRNALIRKLPSVETLGSTTVICSDKTGTLTLNQMTVRKIFVDGTIIDVSGEGYSTKGSFSKKTRGLNMLLEIGALCNDARLEKGVARGDPTEASLLVSAAKFGLKNLNEKYPRTDEIPFSSEMKRMTTVHKIGNRKVAYMKGAPEVVLGLCNRIYDKGVIRKIGAKDRKHILDTNNSFAGSALRVLGFAFKGVKDKDLERELVFVGLQGMIDPPRKEAIAAVERCKKAGIKVVMVTGDHQLTANAIAKELGITGRSLTGEELDRIKDLDKIVDDVGIYARVNPSHKMDIVKALKRRGHIVAMTGDGVNDAPALKDSNIGIAMGVTGTDVTKEASDMILLDDNFASIVNAVEEGRGIYDNIKKFINYLLSCNLGEVLVIFVASLLGWPLPLLAVQILWMNLLTDGLPALALGLDPASPGIMERPPRKPNEGIMSRNMTISIVAIGILVSIGTLLLFWKNMFDIGRARTIAFTSLVMLEVVRVQMIRSNYKVGFFSNKYLIAALVSSVLLQLAVLYTPLRTAFKTVPLPLVDWLYIGAVVIGLFVAGNIVSVAIRKFTKEFD